MQTTCPYCQTTFRITTAQLEMANGQVRCGRCQAIFVAETRPEPGEITETEDTLESVEQAETISTDTGIENAESTASEITEASNTDLDHTELDSSELDKPELDAIDFEAPGTIDKPELDLPELDTDEPESDAKAVQDEENESPASLQLVENSPTTDDDEHGHEPEPDEPGVEAECYPELSETQVSTLSFRVTSEAANSPVLHEAPLQMSIIPDDDEPTSLTGETTESEPETSWEADEDLEAPVENVDTVDEPVTEPVPEPAMAPSAGPATITELPVAPAAEGYDPRQLYPELAEAPANRPDHTGTYTLVALILIGLFIGQGLYLLRDAIAEKPALRPFMESFCSTIGCNLTLPRQPKSVVLVRREIRSHPNVKGALSVTGTIENRATVRQAYPILQLQFHDIEGRIIAGRDFLPRDYLPDDINISRGFDAMQNVNIALELVDPGREAVSFLFLFR